MAVLKMKTVSITGNIERLDDVIDVCAKSGCFQPEPAMNYINISDLEGFEQRSEENPYAVSMQKLSDIVSASGRKLKTVDIGDFKMSRGQAAVFISELVNAIGEDVNRYNKLLQDINETEFTIEQYKHFKNLNVPLDKVTKSQLVKARFGRIPLESYRRLEDYNDNPYVMFFPCEVSDHCYGMYLAPAEEVADVDRIFAGLYFERLRIPNSPDTPAETIEKFTAQLERLKKELEETGQKIDNYWQEKYDDCLKLYTYFGRKSSAFELRQYAAHYKDKFIFIGWVPHNRCDQFKSHIESISDVEFEIENPIKNSRIKVPTALKNFGALKHYQYYVELFGVPSYGEIDPTAFIAITYTILFGIMFADVGQGLFLTLFSLIMWKIKDWKLGPILAQCGIASAFFGLVFGSVFGFEHALDPMYKAMGFSEKPFDVMDASNIQLVLFIPIGIGALLLLLAMCLNVYSSLKQKDYTRGLFSNNGIAGIFFYGSIVFFVAAYIFTGKNLLSPLWVIVCFILPLFVMLFKSILGGLVAGKKHPFPEKFGEYLVENFFEVFDYLISYASNTISFIRIGAFVLIHAIMMSVVFMFAEMAGGVGFVIVVILGNAFVMGLEGLLVSIQGLRLEFYEMFSRFYDGEGRPFEAISLDQKNQD